MSRFFWLLVGWSFQGLKGVNLGVLGKDPKIASVALHQISQSVQNHFQLGKLMRPNQLQGGWLKLLTPPHAKLMFRLQSIIITASLPIKQYSKSSQVRLISCLPGGVPFSRACIFYHTEYKRLKYTLLIVILSFGLIHNQKSIDGCFEVATRRIWIFLYYQLVWQQPF